MLGLPPYSTHLVLLEHDRLHGHGAANWGSRVHWLRTWLIQRTRQWSSHDVIVCGSNPVLGALACAGLARSGKQPLWLCSNGFDAWDYPLAMAGAHDDLFEQAGLPAMGTRFFEALGEYCSERVKVAWGFGIKYEFERAGRARLCFAQAEPARSENWGEARLAAQTMAGRGFKGVAQLSTGMAPARHGGKQRLPVLGCRQVVWTSDRMDGVARLEPGGAKAHPPRIGLVEQRDVRLGRARWHAQAPLDFAEQSREDLRLVLTMGNWG